MDVTAIVISLGVVAVLVFGLDYSGKRYCLNRLRKARAFSPETAVTPEEASMEPTVWSKTTLNNLVKKDKVKMTEDGRYYIVRAERMNLLGHPWSSTMYPANERARS